MKKLKLRMIPGSERAASAGKFRLVVLIDGDFHQVEDDFETFEESYNFGKERVSVGNFIAIYDDKGVALDPKLYRGGFYRVWSHGDILKSGEAAISAIRDNQESLIRRGHLASAYRLGIVLQLAIAEFSRMKKVS